METKPTKRKVAPWKTAADFTAMAGEERARLEKLQAQVSAAIRRRDSYSRLAVLCEEQLATAKISEIAGGVEVTLVGYPRGLPKRGSGSDIADAVTALLAVSGVKVAS